MKVFVAQVAGSFSECACCALASAPSVHQSSRQPTPRITSYNVCYTKLLRWHRHLQWLHDLSLAGDVRQHADVRESVHLCSTDVRGRCDLRITSYNVCYTKLLRISFAQAIAGLLALRFSADQGQSACMLPWETAQAVKARPSPAVDDVPQSYNFV